MAPSAITMKLLARGTHASPRGGCSILELASVLAGERWDSRPSSVHPALAIVASTVNDLLPDDRRRLLVPFAPWLLGTNQPGSCVWSEITRLCAAAAGSAAGPTVGSAAGLAQDRRAGHQLRAALRAVAARPGEDSEQTLCQVLLDCINVCRQLAGQAPVDPRLPLDECPAKLEVEPHFSSAPACDWLDLSYRVTAAGRATR